MEIGLRLFVLNAAGVKEQVYDVPPQLADGRPFEIAFGESAGQRLILEPYNPTPIGRKLQLDMGSIRIEEQ